MNPATNSLERPRALIADEQTDIILALEILLR
jgi:hypothetical protein